LARSKSAFASSVEGSAFYTGADILASGNNGLSKEGASTNSNPMHFIPEIRPLLQHFVDFVRRPNILRPQASSLDDYNRRSITVSSLGNRRSISLIIQSRRDLEVKWMIPVAINQISELRNDSGWM
jgi:hypothetical protein